MKLFKLSNVGSDYGLSSQTAKSMAGTKFSVYLGKILLKKMRKKNQPFSFGLSASKF